MTVKTIQQIARRQHVRLFVAGIAALVLWDPGSGRPAATSNPISLENALAGTLDSWDVSGAGDPTIQGFASDISINTGQTVTFKVKTDSSNYTIKIYRLGYYGGAGARDIATIAPSATLPQTQPSCATDTATGLVDCGNWAPSASWTATGAVSGIYIAKLIRIDTGGSSHIVFVVRDDARKADVLVQTSDTTWQAYNRYGGASLYCAPVGLGVTNAGTAYATGECPQRATKVSYNRPFDTRSGNDARSFVFSTEYPMVRYLEANGYDVKYWAGVDTDRRGTDLVGANKPNVFVSSGHDEYWSGDQRTRIEAARTAGVNLAFFSGNEMYWKTRYEPSIDGSNTAYRTLVTYKETLASAKIDPAVDGAGHPIWTGTWRDPRFSPPGDGGRPENGVTGTIWTVNSGTTAITVPASMANLRFWQHTRVADLTTGVVTLAPETLGYEWNEDLDNGARQNGLVHLSSTTVPGVDKIVDFGATTGTGTGTHTMTLYRHASGALVFDAGTVQWAWGLDATHDGGSHVPDQAMQQSTMNLLADMGAQPATLQIGADPSKPLIAGSSSTDAAAPTSAITSPAAGAPVPGGTPVTISGTASDTGGVVASVEVSVDGGATWHIAQGTTAWTFNWASPGPLGSVTIRSRALDDSGNLEVAGVGIIVSVIPGAAGNCPCTTIWKPTVTPSNLSVADNNPVELGVKFRSDRGGFITGVRFYKGPTAFGTHQGNLWSVNGTLLATATFTGETSTGWQQVNFGTPVPIAANTTYVASYHNNLSGGYAADSGYFANTGVDSWPLHAVQSDAISGGNGVYSYGTTSFPTHTSGHANYWVDVVFAETTVDTTPLEISNINVTVLDGSTATITWTTNRDATSRIDYSTDPSFPEGSTFTAQNGAFVAQHSLTLTGLTPNATYYYTITSVDHLGVAEVSPAPSFSVPGPTLHDTASVDFLAGTQSNTYVAETANGEVTLAPTTGSEFSGPTLPTGWTEVTWSSEGYSIIDNGVLLVDGARVASCVTDTNGDCLPETTTTTPSAIYTSPHSLEFYANFSGDQAQHAGLGQTLGSGAEPWAIFSTMGGGQLFARTNTGGGSVDAALGSSLLGSFHRYRIDWQPASVDYYVDGALVVSHALTVGGPLRPIAASDFNPFGGIVFVDWMRMGPYAGSGTFQSRVFDAQSPVDWRAIQWVAKAPSGTSVAISVRTGDTPTPGAGWTAFVPVAAPGPLTQHSQYIQYQAVLTSSDPNVTPALEDIILSTDHAPVAVNDSAATNVDTSHVFPASGPGSLKFNDTDADATDTLRVTAVTAPAHGTAQLDASGSVTYTPTASFTGDDSFTYTLSDGLLTATATVSMTVGGVTHINSDPVATADSATVAEDSGANPIDVLANDNSGPDPGETLSVTAVTQGAHGSVAFTAAGVSYTPAANYNGPDSFTYTIGDGNGGSATAAVSVIVTSVNDNPVAIDDGATVLEDSVANPIAVLANDNIGPDTDETLSVTGVTQGAHGSVTFTAADVSYTPVGNYNGTDSFTYTIGDGHGGSAAAAVVVMVTAVNDVPSFTKGPDQTAVRNAGAQSVPGWATGLSAGPPDESGQALTFTLTNDVPALFSAGPAVAPNGTLTYTPATGATGIANLTVKVSDSGGTLNGGVDTSPTQNFIITVIHTPPIALCQNVTVTATLVGTAVASVNAGSSDPEGGALTVAQVPPGPYVPGQTSVQLNVTNQFGQTSACSATVTVNPFSIGAAYGFEEASGTTVVDSSGNGNNGTFNATNGPTRTAAGRFGKGMVFDGVDDSITVADSNSLDLTSAMTLMAWVKVETQVGWRDILFKQNANNLAYAAYANNAQTGVGHPAGSVRVGSTTKSGAALDTALQGKWMHVAVTFGAGSLKIYVNGNLQRTVAQTGNLTATTGPLWIGGNQVFLDEYFSGTMDEVRILGTALTVADIRTLMRTPVVPGTPAPPTDSTGLVAAYNFDDGTATDNTGLGHNGVLNGETSAAGIYGQALSFNGTSHLVAIADANDLDFTTGMTLEAWVRPTTMGGWRTVLLKQTTNGLVYGLYASDEFSRTGAFVRIGGTDMDARTADATLTATWSHVVATYDKVEGKLRVWVDGIQRDERAVTGNIVTSTGSLYIGGNQFWGEYFNGLIDNVRIYNRALGIVEIQTNQVTPVQ